MGGGCRGGFKGSLGDAVVCGSNMEATQFTQFVFSFALGDWWCGLLGAGLFAGWVALGGTIAGRWMSAGLYPLVRIQEGLSGVLWGTRSHSSGALSVEVLALRARVSQGFAYGFCAGGLRNGGWGVLGGIHRFGGGGWYLPVLAPGGTYFCVLGGGSWGLYMLPMPL